MNSFSQRLGLPRYQADEHYRRALRSFARRDLRAAFAELDAAIALLPRHAEYHAVLGLFLFEDKLTQRAGEAFEAALALDAYDMLGNYGRGMLAYRAKDWAVAEGCFRRALAAQPQRAETQYYLAMVNHRLGRNDAATRWMEAAAEAFSANDGRRAQQCESWIGEFSKLLAVE